MNKFAEFLLKVGNDKRGESLTYLVYFSGMILMSTKFCLDGAEKLVGLMQKTKKEPEKSLKDVVADKT